MLGRSELVSSCLKALCCVASALVVGCGGGNGDERAGGIAPADEKPAYGDAIVSGSIGDASVLIPMLAGDSASHSISGLIFDGLIAYDKNLSDFEPRLAE